MKQPFRCIAIDMGAGSIRLLVGTVNTSDISLQEIHRFKNEIKIIDGHDRWDIEYIISEIVIGIKKSLDLHGNQIQSFGVDSWGVDFVLLDEKGKLLEIPISYRDARTEGMQEIWEKAMSKEETFERTGINFYIFNSLLQLFAIKNDPVLKKAQTILFIPNYVYHQLAGSTVNELSIASTSQLVNVNSKQMDDKVLGFLNLLPKKFGEIIDPGRIIGHVNHQGLPANDIKAVSVCSHDTASAIVAVPAEKSGFAFISTGTWCIVGVESDKPALSEFALKSGFTNERGYNNTYRVLKNILGLWLIQGLQKSFGDCFTYHDLEKMANEASATGHYIDPEDTSFFNPENMKTAFDNFFKKTGQSIPATPGEYIKCAYNSLCNSFAKCISQMELMLETNIEVIHIIGGGSQSEYLCQTTANTCCKKVISGPVEGAGIGNIIVQAIAMGYITDLKEGRQMVKNSFDCKEYEASPPTPLH
jgi:rhamnulokinase